MGRSKKIDRPFHLQARIPESLAMALDLELYSELEGCVPKGRRSELIATLVREWLASRGVIL